MEKINLLWLFTCFPYWATGDVPPAAAGVSLGYVSISTMTNRFRSGIARNIGRFCLHIYFPPRGSVTGPTQVIGDMSHPVLLGGLASMATFDVMFLSSLPGQREPAGTKK